LNTPATRERGREIGARRGTGHTRFSPNDCTEPDVP
jgi:hypothetical protein